jgi:hypothetical protein
MPEHTRARVVEAPRRPRMSDLQREREKVAKGIRTGKRAKQGNTQLSSLIREQHRG